MHVDVHACLPHIQAKDNNADCGAFVGEAAEPALPADEILSVPPASSGIAHAGEEVAIFSQQHSAALGEGFQAIRVPL